MDKKITHSIDWFQYSVAWPNEIAEWPINDRAELALAYTCVPKIDVDRDQLTRPEDKPPFGMHGYSNTYDLKYASVHINPKRRDQKAGVRMTGQDLTMYRDFGGTETRLIDFVTGVKATTSRVDIAFDLHGYDIELMRIFEDWKRGKVACRGRTVQPLNKATREPDGSIVEAVTLYFGSRTSEVMIRMYDKGKQTGTNIDWTRIEIELKGERATIATGDMKLHGVAEVGKQILREYFYTMPYKFWRDIIKGESVELTKVERKITDRQTWLLNVVIPVLREEMNEEFESEHDSWITREVEGLVREGWRARAIAHKIQYKIT